jgi:hypothetical protein
MKQRNESGQFEQKGDEPRVLRSIRLTDTCWDTLGETASERSLSRADLLEELVEDGSSDRDEDGMKESIIEEMESLIQGLKKDGDNELEISSKDKAAGRRVLRALIDHLSP